MMLKVTPYFEYMPWWYYSADTRYPEKWNRQIWRSGKVTPYRLPSYTDKPVLPPPKPPAKPAQPVPYDWAKSKLTEPAALASGTGAQLIPRREGLGGWADNILTKPTLPPELMNLSPEEFSRRMDEMTDGNNPPVPPVPPVRQKPRLPAEILEMLKPPPVPGEGDPIDELDAMVGLGSVKDQVKKTLSLIKLGKARDAAGLPRLELTHHLVFTGNPGTGKTTVARIIGRIYRNMGLLKSGHLVEVDRGDLIASYTGQTPPLVKEVVERATDGVLFIDEAYSLAQARDGHDNYGAEAIATLLKLMEDRRGRLVVIAAGYRAEMATFINSNPGLVSRFKTFIDFPDYTATELMEILQNICTAAGCQMSMDAMRKAAEVMMKMDHAQNPGNGRAVRNLFEECFARQALRLAEREQYGTVDLTMIEAGDVPAFEEMRM
jgi:stage V sporulation protein K